MIGGQIRDLAAENQTLSLDQLTQLHRMKTGALFVTACLCSIIGHSDYEHLSMPLQGFAESLGLAFQIQDDILDVESDSDILGKPQGSDLRQHKTTFVTLLGMQGAKDHRDHYIQCAHEALKALPFESPFLAQLTDFVRDRRF
jgi:geranylgeranyl pyrophosphate synthase